VGGLSPVVEDETGFHIIKVEAKEGGKVPSFDELRDQAARMVEVSKRAELYDKYISELRKKAVIRKF
jgi:parvulin-like peptidyl-prolyl isomerase